MNDHRKLGRELNLFDSDPLIGAGLPFWLPDGAAARYEVERYIHEVERRAGYRHVYSPVIGKREMFERSGHAANFADDMFPPMVLSADDQFQLRPSMCPHHALIFASRARSYRELPLRIAETGPQYRAERSGVLGGLTRVRSIWLNDAHNFCALDDVGSEIAELLELIRQGHRDLGVVCSGYRLSLRGDGDKYAGTRDMWAQASDLLRKALVDVDFVEAPGEAAFYGPKIDVQIMDPQGRETTLCTIQVDFHQPEAFDLSYVDASGERRRPVMVHRSILGSMERLFAHLIEVHGGAFPVWYAPVQVLAVSVGPASERAAVAFARRCVESGLRADYALDGSMGARIRGAAARKIPYVAVIGEREAAAGEVALRLRGGERLEPMSEAAAVRLVGAIADSRSHSLVP